MTLRGALLCLAALNGVQYDSTDPIGVMPQRVKDLRLMHQGKVVNIEERVKGFFAAPGFVCEDVPNFWELLLANPGEYVIDLTNEFHTPIVTL